MRILISADKNRAVLAQPGNTMAEKQMRYDATIAAKGSPARPWHDYITKNRGRWVEVETDYLFDYQFNTDKARVDGRMIDAIDFSPEFRDVDDFLDHVQERYDRDWPGQTVSRSLEIRISIGSLRDETPSE